MDFKLKDEYLEILEELNLNRTRDLMLVSIQNQRMYLQKENSAVKTYVISTSLKNPSCQQDSFGTPWGLHEVSDIIGSDQPLGMVFNGTTSDWQMLLGNVMHKCKKQLDHIENS